MASDPDTPAVLSHSAPGLPPLDVSRTDDPEVVAEAAREDYSLHVVPRSWRLSAPKMALAWSALMSAMFWVVVAAGASLVVGTVQALIGLAVAALVHGSLCLVMSRTAADSGQTVGLFSRAMFGYRGAAIATLALGLTGTWFAVFEGSVLAVAAQAEFGGPVWIWYLVVTAVCIPLVIGGVRQAIEKVNAWLLPVFLAGLVTTVVWATVVHGYDGSWLTAPPTTPTAMAGPGWLYVFAIYMGVFSNVLYTFDFARMGRREDRKVNGVHTFGYTFYFFTILVNGAVGIYLVHTIPLAEVSESGLVVGIVQMMGLFGVVFIVATQLKINTANFYVASTNFQGLFSRTFHLTLSRTTWVFIVGALSFAVMTLNIFTFINTWLSYQGAVLVAWVGIALVTVADARRRGRAGDVAFEFRPGRVPSVDLGGVVAWVVASGVGVTLIATGSAIASTWALVLTFVLAVVIAAVGKSLTNGRSGAAGRSHDPRDEVEDVWQDRVRCHVCHRSYVAVEMDRDPAHDHEAICAACATSSSFLDAVAAQRSAART
jgi:purine-cytosine permease-like protein